jgi:non-heme chloroperoxidase
LAGLDTKIFRFGFAASDGARLSALETKAAEKQRRTVVLVPGWTMPARLWRPQLENLAVRHRALALDPRGQGESQVTSSGYHIDRRADDIAEFILRYAPVTLVGWSLAALEVLQCVHRHGEGMVNGLVLVDSAVGQIPGLPENDAFRSALRADRERAVSGFVREMFAKPVPDEEVARLTREAMRMPLEESLALFPSHLPSDHWRAVIEKFSKPLLYVVTPRLKPQADKLKERRPATQVEVFEGAGHALFVDEPLRFNQVLKQFVDSLPS